MSEKIQDKQVFTLKEVSESIKRTLTARYTTSFWLKAEMNKLNRYAHTGHCYPDLVQKEQGKVVAQMRSIIWANDYRQIAKKFLAETGEELGSGINILCRASIMYDANYGLTLHIHDIDPVFALGELEREKNETIRKLKEEGIFEMNKTHQLPLLPKRIAIISVESSKGLADFMQLMQARMIGFNLDFYLFPSLLQGDKAATQMINQLERIRKVSQHFDLVAIIRGGGGDVGLAAFNNYLLAQIIAKFPLPVFTGIGHATNLTVSEMVAHTNAITPSELADILLEQFEYFKSKLILAQKNISKYFQVFENENQRLKNQMYYLQMKVEKHLDSRKSKLAALKTEMHFLGHKHLQIAGNSIEQAKVLLQHSGIKLVEHHNRNLERSRKSLTQLTSVLLNDNSKQITALQKSVDLLRPENVLKRGYSLSYHQGKILTDSSLLAQGDKVETVLAQGGFISTVDTKSTENQSS